LFRGAIVRAPIALCAHYPATGHGKKVQFGITLRGPQHG
jgi:hypothetical protein